MTLPVVLGCAFLAFCPTIGLAVSISRNGLLPAYDYVVVGGGTSGLTVANRLSEDEGGFIDGYTKEAIILMEVSE